MAGACVLVTRPQGQSEAVLKKLRMAGAKALHCPVIAIRSCHRTPGNAAKIARLSNYQAVVFISKNAVVYGLRLLLEHGIDSADLPLVAAIGRSTAALLQHKHVRVAACPIKPDSAALVEMPALYRLTAGNRILIFRGKGGKETLARIFAARGVDTEYAEVYERVRPAGRTIKLTLSGDRRVDLIMLTSRDSLQSLYAMTPLRDRAKLLGIPLLLGSRTLLDLVGKLQFRSSPVVAASPLDDDMLACAVAWWQQRRRFARRE